MGCGGNSSMKYKHEGKDRAIDIKHRITLAKYSFRAIAIIKTRRMRIENASQIANLPKPTFQNEPTKETLMNKKDFENFMERDGKDLKLNNYYEPLNSDQNTKYKGQWTSDRSHAQGLGILISKGGE